LLSAPRAMLAERGAFELLVPSLAWAAHSHRFALYGWSCVTIGAGRLVVRLARPRGKLRHPANTRPPTLAQGHPDDAREVKLEVFDFERLLCLMFQPNGAFLGSSNLPMWSRQVSPKPHSRSPSRESRRSPPSRKGSAIITFDFASDDVTWTDGGTLLINRVLEADGPYGCQVGRRYWGGGFRSPSPCPDWMRPAGLRAVGEQWCSRPTEISHDQAQ
jgi:hypothetical protein